MHLRPEALCGANDRGRDLGRLLHEVPGPGLFDRGARRLEEVGVSHGGRVNGRYDDAVLGELGPEGQRERIESRFGRGVVPGVRHGELGHHRDDVDYEAATSRHHVLQRGLGSVYDPHIVGLKLRLYLLYARLEERLVQSITGVVDQHVHPSPTLEGRLHKVPYLFLLRDIGDHREDLTGVPFQTLARAFETVLQAVTDGHAATFFRERSSSLRTDAAGAGDHDHPATQPYHESIPILHFP